MYRYFISISIATKGIPKYCNLFFGSEEKITRDNWDEVNEKVSEQIGEKSENIVLGNPILFEEIKSEESEIYFISYIGKLGEYIFNGSCWYKTVIYGEETIREIEEFLSKECEQEVVIISIEKKG